jgi:arylsulfatase
VLHERGISHELGHIIDVPATVLDAAGVDYPADFSGRSVQPLEGKSLVPLLRTGRRQGHESLCWATSGSRAVRVGSWKLVAASDGPWELYDLATDRTELHDLAAEQPDRVQSMSAIFDAWSKRKP